MRGHNVTGCVDLDEMDSFDLERATQPWYTLATCSKGAGETGMGGK